MERTELVNRICLEVAQRQLETKRCFRPENPAQIKSNDPHTRQLFATQNRDSNRALEAFWQRQVKKYSGN